jgi:pimeloyl-ACP methyl ester carboxylesterase
MDRRTVLATGAAAGLAASLPAHARKVRRVKTPITFVLVHGAWHGGWCWRDVRVALTAQGHRVYTPTLTGQGERLHLTRADLKVDDHIRDVTALIDFEDLSTVVLVGHSYGGVVISGVADQRADKIKHAIYLDALVPIAGQPTFVLPPEMAKGFIDGHRMPAFPPEMFDVPKGHPAYAWVQRRVTDMPAGVLTSPVPLTGAWEKVQRTYVECTTNTLDGPREAQKRVKAAKWPYRQLKSGHDAMVTEPAALTKLLLELARI